jgi:glyoxylase-like metal-dependent hydrolase (beta-lactamase superfamily II)
LSDIEVIDTHMLGLAGITATYLIRGEQTALIETGPKSSVDHVLSGLDSSGVTSLDWIIVTHIHLDHAGAAGTLAQRFPQARVAVHPVGAPHLIDPSKLWTSAARIYGDEMTRMWGGVDAIAADRIHVLEDGDSIDLGGRTLTAIETPGHAYHHHAFLDDLSGTIFVGDALGVRLGGAGIIRPATPPPEFHLEKAVESIARINSLGASALWLTHFSRHDDGGGGSVAAVCEEAADGLRRWASWVQSARSSGAGDLDAASAYVAKRARAELEAQLSPEAADRVENTTSTRMNTWGYLRYLERKEAPTGPPEKGG